MTPPVFNAPVMAHAKQEAARNLSKPPSTMAPPGLNGPVVHAKPELARNVLKLPSTTAPPSKMAPPGPKGAMVHAKPETARNLNTLKTPSKMTFPILKGPLVHAKPETNTAGKRSSEGGAGIMQQKKKKKRPRTSNEKSGTSKSDKKGAAVSKSRDSKASASEEVRYTGFRISHSRGCKKEYDMYKPAPKRPPQPCSHVGLIAASTKYYNKYTTVLIHRLMTKKKSAEKGWLRRKESGQNVSLKSHLSTVEKKKAMDLVLAAKPDDRAKGLIAYAWGVSYTALRHMEQRMLEHPDASTERKRRWDYGIKKKKPEEEKDAV